MSLQAPLQFHGRHVLISRTECMTRGAYGRALLNCLVDPKHVSSSCAKAELSNEGIALGLICEPRAKKVFVTVALPLVCVSRRFPTKRCRCAVRTQSQYVCKTEAWAAPK